MKKISFYTLTTFLFLAIFPFSQKEKETVSFPSISSEVEACYIENVSFGAGEEIVYQVYYNWNFVWLTAGEIRFKVEDAGNEYHLSATGRSYKSYEWFYKVRDRYDTYIDKATLLPRLSSKTIEEGSHRLYDRTILDQNARKATTLRGKTAESAKEQVFDLEDCMHDMLSILYHSRNIDFNEYQKGEIFPIKIFMDKTVYPLSVKYLGKEKRKNIKGVGKFNAILFSPEVVQGTVFKEGNQMRIWVTDDKNKIPLMIESPLSVGAVKIALKEYKGLKHDLAAVVD